MYSLSVPKVNNPDNVQKQNIEEEIRRMMDMYGNDVLRTSYLYLKDVQKAEDAFQEVFIKVFNKLDTFRGDSSEKTWLIKITVNVCRDMLRSSWLKKVFLTDKIKERSSGSGIEDRIIKMDDNRLLFNEVTTLPSAFREVIILFYYQNCDTAEISKILNVAEGTVRSRLYRARELLKNKLGGRIDLSE